MKKTAKRYIKEEAEETDEVVQARCKSEDMPEDVEQKRKTRRVGGKLVKEDEDEEEETEAVTKEDEDESEDANEEKPSEDEALTKDEGEDEEPTDDEALTKEDEEEPLSDDEMKEAIRAYKRKKKSAIKAESGINPEESAADATQAGATTSPGAGVPSTQNVFVPTSNVRVGRESPSGSSAGQSPSEVAYGKSVRRNPDLKKSPLFVELSAQMSEFEKAFVKRIASVEKSINDRLININKTIVAIEKFYQNPFYKDAMPDRENASVKDKAEYSF